MRIVAGEFRSRKLNTLEGNNTRPTQDKIKEAMFSAIGNVVYDANVLDLFAGCGNIGLESLSRGASKVVFCDHHKDAIQVIRSNIDVLKVSERCEINYCSYSLTLQHYQQEVFDFIFIDPPYANKVIEECLRYIAEHDMLSEHGVIVIESHKEDEFEERYNNLYKWKEKKYGITRLTYYIKESE